MVEPTAPKKKKPVTKKKTSSTKVKKKIYGKASKEQQLVEDLESSFYGVEGRSKEDRRREFRETFLGSDTGKRVLHDILGMAKLSARMVAPFPSPVDVNRMLVLEGARQLAADIIDVISREIITEKPTKTNSKGI